MIIESIINIILDEIPVHAIQFLVYLGKHWKIISVIFKFLVHKIKINGLTVRIYIKNMNDSKLPIYEYFQFHKLVFSKLSHFLEAVFMK